MFITLLLMSKKKN